MDPEYLEPEDYENLADVISDEGVPNFEMEQ